MKNVFLLTSLFSINTFAVAPAKMVGQFIVKQSVPMMMYTASECKTAGGSWDGEVCVVDSQDSVTVTNLRGKFNLEVSTIGNNAHMCDFSGPAQRVNGKLLVAAVKSEFYDGKAWKKGVCKVSVKYAGANSVSVATNGKCGSFCGSNVHLEIDGARRK